MFTAADTDHNMCMLQHAVPKTKFTDSGHVVIKAK